MSKKKEFKKRSNINPPKSIRRKRIIGLSLVGIAIIIVIAGSLMLTNDKERKKRQVSNNYNIMEPQFLKEGELTFIKNDSTELKSIDIEIADKEEERVQGMMFRKSMSDDMGMLFIFERLEPRSFWMRNTLISLDIIYVDDKMKIVDIAHRAEPKSEKSIPSKADALYVVEVRGGFCEEYGINEGDIIRFKRIK